MTPPRECEIRICREPAFEQTACGLWLCPDHKRAHEEGEMFHCLTEDGKAYAHQVAQQIANEMGLHVTWTATGGNRFYRTTHCTCGWSTRLYSQRFDAGHDHYDRIARHLAEAAGAARPTGELT